MNAFFITGTDTDSGKTTVSKAVLTYLASQGKRVLGIKPIASGCDWQLGQWCSSDETLLAEQSAVRALPSPWRFAEPIAPHIAAAKTGAAILLESLKAYICYHRHLDLDCLLIEGAGGLLVPLGLEEKTTWLSLVQSLNLPVIVVVGLQLGCINHALLTLMALEQAGQPALGWIANHLSADFTYAQENIEAILALSRAPLLGRCLYGGELVLCESGRQFLA